MHAIIRLSLINLLTLFVLSTQNATASHLSETNIPGFIGPVNRHGDYRIQNETAGINTIDMMPSTQQEHTTDYAQPFANQSHIPVACTLKHQRLINAYHFIFSLSNIDHNALIVLASNTDNEIDWIPKQHITSALLPALIVKYGFSALTALYANQNETIKKFAGYTNIWLLWNDIIANAFEEKASFAIHVQKIPMFLLNITTFFATQSYVDDRNDNAHTLFVATNVIRFLCVGVLTALILRYNTFTSEHTA